MKNSTKGLIINLSAVLLWAIPCVLLALYAYSVLGGAVEVVVPASLAGLLINYLLALFFHELGHLVSALADKMHLRRVNFGLFTYDKEQSPKVRLLTLFGENAGESDFVPTRSVHKNDIASLAFGGLAFSLLYLVGVMLVLLLVKSPLWFCLFGAGGCAAGYLFTVNALPFDKTSDGSLLFDVEGYASTLAAAAEVEREIAIGECVGEPELFKVSTQPVAVYYDYLFLIKAGNLSGAYERIAPLIDKTDALTEQEYQLLFPEILCYLIINGRADEAFNVRAESFFNGSNQSPAAIRAHFVFRHYTGQDQWAQTLIKTYNRKCGELPEFFKQTEEVLAREAHLTIA